MGESECGRLSVGERGECGRERERGECGRVSVGESE